MLNKIKMLFSPKPSNIDVILAEQVDLVKSQQDMTYDHLIAIARLSMIKPSTLFKEARNVEANAKYLTRMMEEMKNGKN